MKIFQDFMKAFLANTYWKIVFVGSLIYEQQEAVLPEDTIARKTHHPDFQHVEVGTNPKSIKLQAVVLPLQHGATIENMNNKH